MDSTKVTLQAAESKLKLPGTTGIGLHCPHDYVNYVEDDNFWIDMYAELLRGYGVLLILETNVIAPPKKRRLLPDKPVVYGVDERAGIFKDYIRTHSPHWQWLEKELPSYSYGQEYPRKVLFVYSSVTDRKLVELNYHEDTPEVWFYGYAKSQLGAGFENLVEEVCQPNPVAAITIAGHEIFIRESYYPKAQIVERVSRISEKYHKTLEVKL